MRLIFAAAMLSVLCLPGAAFAQPATRADAPRPHSLELRENDRVALQCDRFAGAAKEQCLLDEGRRKALEGEGRGLSRSCDALAGPEKERCLRLAQAGRAILAPGH